MKKDEQNKLDDKQRSNNLKSRKETLNKHPQPKEHAHIGEAVYAEKRVGRAHKHRLEDVPQSNDKHGDVNKKGRYYSEKPRSGTGQPFGSTHGPEFHPDLKPVPHNPVDWSYLKPDAPELPMPNRYSDSTGQANPFTYSRK